MNVYEKIKEYEQKGFLFHGSPEEIDALEPRQAKDTGGSTSGNQNGVYAAEDPRLAILSAVIHFVLGKKSRWGWSIQDKNIHVSGKNVVKKDGWVYVVSPDDFELVGDENQKELVAYKKVTPVERLFVSKQILDELENTTFDLHP